jgi:hypothetical protein
VQIEGNLRKSWKKEAYAMTDKKKRMLLLTVCSLACIALIVCIAARFAGREQPVNTVQGGENTAVSNPLVNISTSEPVIDMQGDNPSSVKDTSSGMGADSTGTEQTIQADPVKPEAPEPPSASAKDHSADDVSDADKNAQAPPTYKPEQKTVTTTPSEPAPGSINDKGQQYFPGFGWVDVGGPNEGGTLDDMYESGEKVGIMD